MKSTETLKKFPIHEIPTKNYTVNIKSKRIDEPLQKAEKLTFLSDSLGVLPLKHRTVENSELRGRRSLREGRRGEQRRAWGMWRWVLMGEESFGELESVVYKATVIVRVYKLPELRFFM